MLTTPLKPKDIRQLCAGDEILLSGIIYTARDQAHKKIAGLIRKGKKVPLELKNQIIYYCGPTPAPAGRVIGSCGPTTSARMDTFLAPLLKKGMLAMIGKGRRGEQARKLIKRYRAIYFLAPAGCGALLAERVVSRRLVAFREFGPEAVYRLEVDRFPLIVGIDSRGRDIYARL